ncbi:hypothetical protein ACH5RR_026266 [Cinchona calisaya]|uniref:Retrovirus-related Pol polyprotein from transposon TNT 1-94-like beta-barrel domain-containing protein n=1 Tax=Cinchona calisaya TaxID=153742 RepID=A0ABD2Z493_9GENT
MTDEPSLFTNIKSKNCGKVTFGDNLKAKSLGIDDIGKNGETLAKNVLLVDNFNYNLLSVIQLYNRDLYVFFNKHECLIIDKKFIVLFRGKRHNDVYVVYFDNIDNGKVKCLTVTKDDRWLRHRRLCHFNMIH